MMQKISALGRVAHCGLVLALLSWTTTAVSAATEVFSSAQSTAIRGAAARGDQGAMYALIFSAISQRPEKTIEIVAKAAELVPEHRDAIVSTVGAAFPSQASQFAARPWAKPAAETGSSVPVPAPTASETLEPPAAHTDAPAMPPSEVGDATTETAEVTADAETDDDRLPLWSGEGELGAAHNSGNTQNDSIQFGSKLVWAPGNWENEVQASYNFLNDSGETTERRFMAQAGPRYNFTDRWFGWGLVRFEDDKNDGFQWVLTEAVGPAYKLIKTDAVNLSVGAGPGMQHLRERQENGGGVTNEGIGVGIMDFDWTVVEDTTFSNDFKIAVNPERTRLENITALTLKVYGDFAARLSYNVRYNSSPGEDANTTDTTALASVVYKFEAN